ncbi:MAG: ATP-binding cassette domain-containing protein [Lachnospira sp.]
MEYILETRNLTKQFPGRLAVNNVSIHIKKGDIYGFIGKNGAGKTTTMKLILGMINKTSGDISLFGSENLNKGRKKIGSLIEAPGIYQNFTAYENLKQFSLIYGGTEDEIRKILQTVNLDNTGKRKAGNFSLGMKQRLGIAIALLGNPELLILDEPINGLDPVAIKEIRDTLIALHDSGVTILISSHLLDELSKITTTYGIIADGKLVEEISAKALMERCKNKLTINVDDVEKAISVLKDNNYYTDSITCDEHNIYLTEHIEDRGVINSLLVKERITVNELSFDYNGFENYFIERIGK